MESIYCTNWLDWFRNLGLFEHGIPPNLMVNHLQPPKLDTGCYIPVKYPFNHHFCWSNDVKRVSLPLTSLTPTKKSPIIPKKSHEIRRRQWWIAVASRHRGWRGPWGWSRCPKPSTAVAATMPCKVPQCRWKMGEIRKKKLGMARSKGRRDVSSLFFDWPPMRIPCFLEDLYLRIHQCTWFAG